MSDNIAGAIKSEPGLTGLRTDIVFISHTLLFLLLVSFVNPLSADENKPVDMLTPPGELHDIGTHRLHLNCKGEGKPTVIVDTGMGSLSLEWSTIQNSLARSVKTCTYDRAGYGWSDPGPSPRTSRQIASELYELVKVSELEGPFLLVGHSFGGYNMRYFATRYPDKVAGVILVDASHPQQFTRMNLRPIMSYSAGDLQRMRQSVSIPVMHRNYPGEIRELAFNLMMAKKSHYARIDELEHFEESANQVQKTAQYMNVPLVVLTRGMRVWPQDPMGTKREIIWREMQSELSHLSSMSLQIIANYSGHSPHMDQPMLVSSVILNTVHATEQINPGLQKAAAPLPKLVVSTRQAKRPARSSLARYFDIPMVGADIIGEAHPLYDNTTIIAAIYNH